MDILIYVIWSVFVIVGIEVFAYFWHRFGSHNDYIPGIHDAHRIHHLIDLTYNHEAHEDFIWTLLMLIIFELSLGMGILINIIPSMLGLVTIVVSIITFFWNWWIHTAYHTENHWLNNFNWFRIEKSRHYVHHIDPHSNYGIASHFTDMIMGTWKSIV